MTNYERIKNMSIEEMAVSLMCPADIDECFIKHKDCNERNCCQCTLEYLKSDDGKGNCNEISIDDLELSVRSWNCLKRANINTVKDILDNIDDLPKVRNLGQKCYEEVLEKIKAYR